MQISIPRLSRDLSVLDKQIISGPKNPSKYQEWLDEISLYRTNLKQEIAYDSVNNVHGLPQLSWCQKDIIQIQVMIEDSYLFNQKTQKYTPDLFLDDLQNRLGKIDSLLLWPTYPNIGIDSRNQFDCWDYLPGGKAKIKEVISFFHKHHVKILLPIMYWDNGTRPFDVPMDKALVQLAIELEVDGLFGDTLGPVPKSYNELSLENKTPLLLEPENGLNYYLYPQYDHNGIRLEEKALEWCAATWGYWPQEYIPPISKYKWIEPRHQVHLCHRWNTDRTVMLQDVLFNGIGIQAWENIWGIWNEWGKRDSNVLRRIATLLRSLPNFFKSPLWEPHFPAQLPGIFISKFTYENDALFVFVNRDTVVASGDQLILPNNSKEYFLDLWLGQEISPRIIENSLALQFTINPDSVACILVCKNKKPYELLLKEMNKLSGSYSELDVDNTRSKVSLQHVTRKTPEQITEPSLRESMVYLQAGAYNFSSQAVVIEGGNREGVGLQYPWENCIQRHHNHLLNMNPFLMDKYLVTNGEYFQFTRETKYYPSDDFNFLKHWNNGIPPESLLNSPVVWVSHEDALAYAHWRGCDLPTEWEWQYAAQCNDNRTYPWGNDWDDKKIPPFQTGTEIDLTLLQRGSLPESYTPTGIGELCGWVWQWTDIYKGDHINYAVLKGGSCYRPQKSTWYFPRVTKLTQHGLLLTMSPGRDRAATIGFLCVKR